MGSTAIGIQAKDGVVLAVEKRLTSPLIVPSSVEKVFEIDTHIGCAVSGLTADARMLVEHARVEGQVRGTQFPELYKQSTVVSDVASPICLQRVNENGESNAVPLRFGSPLW